MTEIYELEPHAYVPSTLHMGDCAICGHLQGSPIHSLFKRDTEMAKQVRTLDEVNRAKEIATHENHRNVVAIAMECLEEEARVFDTERAIAISQAISLKRIADLLDESNSVRKQELLRAGSSHE